MDTLILILEIVVVFGAIIMGTRSSGVALGLWGGLGVAVLVFVFQLPPGSPPVDAILIILAVVTTASLMQVAGGIDWMVAMAAKVIASNPKQITLLAPLTAFLFCVGAGTGNILYPLLPVIYDLSYQNGIRPSRPLSLSVVVTGVALCCSPVSAAMAAMITLTDVEPYNFGLGQVLIVTIPAALIGIFVTSIFVRKMGKELADDPEIQARIASGQLADPSQAVSTAGELTFTKEGRRSALIFLSAVGLIVILGLFPDLRPVIGEGEEAAPLGMSPTIEMLMLTTGVAILLFCRPKVSEVPEQSVFKAGMVAAIALFGLAWLTDTFISANYDLIVDTIGGMVSNYVVLFALAVFLIAALTTSQSTATRTMVPIGLASGVAPGVVTGLWAGGMNGVYTLPTNGTQIAAANFDLSGTTKLGTKLYDHSFFVPMLIMTVVITIAGLIIGSLVG
jgi:anaerobic C4-dicarboxylate transporter DcuA/anaerobic C4-dicarboxylate transporter DcuB